MAPRAVTIGMQAEHSDSRPTNLTVNLNSSTLQPGSPQVRRHVSEQARTTWQRSRSERSDRGEDVAQALRATGRRAIAIKRG